MPQGPSCLCIDRPAPVAVTAPADDNISIDIAPVSAPLLSYPTLAAAIAPADAIQSPPGDLCVSFHQLLI